MRSRACREAAVKVVAGEAVVAAEVAQAAVELRARRRCLVVVEGSGRAGVVIVRVRVRVWCRRVAVVDPAGVATSVHVPERIGLGVVAAGVGILVALDRGAAVIGPARLLALVLVVIGLQLAIDLEEERELETGQTLAGGRVLEVERARELVAAIVQESAIDLVVARIDRVIDRVWVAEATGRVIGLVLVIDRVVEVDRIDQGLVTDLD